MSIVAAETEPLVAIAFRGAVIEWRGPSPFFFVRLPARHARTIRRAARLASYGWGVIPVEATVAAVAFSTSLFPKDDGYLLPLKLAVRRQAELSLGSRVEVSIRIHARYPSA